MNTGAFGENFPYSNFHDLNLDWIIKIAKDFLDQYTHIQEVIANGEILLTETTTTGVNTLNDTAEQLTALLNEWYQTHSDDIATQLADALTTMQAELTDLITEFNARAEQKALDTLESIPDDYTELSDKVTEWNIYLNDISTRFLNDGIIPITNRNKYVDLSGTTVVMTDSRPTITGDSHNNLYSASIIACNPGDLIIVSGHGGSSTRLWGFIDSTGSIISKADSNIRRTSERLTAPAGTAWLVMNRDNNELASCFIGARWEMTLRNIKLLGNTSIIPLSMNTRGGTSGGLTWTVDNTGTKITINGTPTNYSNFFLFSYNDGMPYGFEAGKEYLFTFKNETENNQIEFLIIYKHQDDSTENIRLQKSTFITIPETVVGMSLSFHLYQISHTYDNENLWICATEANSVVQDIFKKRAEQWTNAPKNILPDFGKLDRNVSAGVEWTWNSEKNIVTLNGTATQESHDWLYLYTSDMPAEITPGFYYKLQFIPSMPGYIFCNIYIQLNDETVERTTYDSPSLIYIPDNAHGITIRLTALTDITYDNATASMEFQTVPFGIKETVTDNINTAAYMYGIGSSMLRGYVYPDGVMDHKASFENSPYGNIALALNIPESNVSFTTIGSTGLLYDNGRGNFLEHIEETDLTPYDYILTEINRPDLRSTIALGSMNSTAGDGSLAGAVLELLQYIKSSQPNATLILVGPPPSNYNQGYSYENVFTAIYGNGYSIHDADILMHRLAVKYHFIFIDWEDLNLSYYYPDLCYEQSNVHPVADVTLRAMGLYLARCLSYTSSQVKLLVEDQS